MKFWTVRGCYSVLYFYFGTLEILTLLGRGIYKLFTRILLKNDQFTFKYFNWVFY